MYLSINAEYNLQYHLEYTIRLLLNMRTQFLTDSTERQYKLERGSNKMIAPPP